MQSVFLTSVAEDDHLDELLVINLFLHVFWESLDAEVLDLVQVVRVVLHGRCLVHHGRGGLLVAQNLVSVDLEILADTSRPFKLLNWWGLELSLHCFFLSYE